MGRVVCMQKMKTKRAEECHLFDPYNKERNAVKTIVLRQKERRKPARHGFETLSDIIRRLEDHIVPDQFDVALSSQLDGAHLLRQEMNEAAQ
jgi:thiamine monophosphate synthase